MSFFHALIAGSQGTRYYIIPATFSFFTDQIWRRGDTLETDFDFDVVKNSITGTEKWVDPQGGNNANNGDSPGAPYKTLAYAYATGGARIINVKSGALFLYADGFMTTRPTQNTKLQLYGGDEPAYLTTGLAMTWTVDGTLTNTYTAPSSETARTISNVFDRTYVDSNGDEIGYVKQTSAAAVDSAPGSYFYNATTDVVYVRTWDSREPDADVIACVSDITAVPINNTNDSSNLHFENIKFFGGIACEIRTTAGRNVSFHNCSFQGASTNGSFFSRGLTNVILKECRASYGFTDGFNYTDDCTVFEWKCTSIQNGRDNTTEGFNGSTGHANAKVISVGGSHQYSRGKAIQYIGASKALYIRCVAGNSLVSTATDDDTAGYSTDSTNPGTTVLWLYECQFVGNALSNRFWNFPTSTINVFDGTHGNVNQLPNRQDANSTLNVLTEGDVYA